MIRMKVACDRCLKIENEELIKYDWLKITTGNGYKYLFCSKCADVFRNTMFNCDAKIDEESSDFDEAD